MKITRILSAKFYQSILKPLLFLRDAEAVHNTFTTIGSLLGKSPITRQLISFMFAHHDPRNRRIIDGILFSNPIGLSAGFDYNADLTQIMPSVGFGFATVGTVTFKPYVGNPTPRLGRFPKSQALLVNKGFKNIGAHAVIAKLEGLRFAIPVGISIGSTNTTFPSIAAQVNDVCKTFQLFEKSNVKHAYYELNISCPNTHGGQPFTELKNLAQLLDAVDKLHVKKPIFVKMPIDLGEPYTLKMLKVIDKSSMHGVIFGNLTKDKTNPAVHPDDRAVWQTRKGNLSGKPTWDRSNALIRLTRKNFGYRFTIIGTGGVFSGQDAMDKLNHGADLVQLITGMVFQGPQLIGDISEYLAENYTDS